MFHDRGQFKKFDGQEVDGRTLKVELAKSDTFRHALTVAKIRAMPTSRGMKVLPRPLKAAPPVAPFADYPNVSLQLGSSIPNRRARFSLDLH